MQKMTILLVEDESILAIDEQISLETCGYEVLIARNAVEALSITERNSAVSLILMDIGLGEGIDGTEAARLILDRRTVPIIFLTSHTGQAEVDRASALPTYGYLVKGTAISVIDASIRTALRLFDALNGNHGVIGDISPRAQPGYADGRNDHRPDSSAEENLPPRMREDSPLQDQQLFQNLLNEAPYLIFFKDINGHYIRNSRAHANHFGLSDPSVLAGMCDFDFYEREHAQTAYEDEQLILKTGKTISKEEKQPLLMSGPAETGEETWLLTAKMPLKSSSGEIVGTFGLSQDLSEQKRTEGELAKQRSLLESIIRSSTEPIFAKDRDGRYVIINDAGAKKLGYGSVEDILGRTDTEMREVADQHGFAESDRLVLTLGTDWEQEVSAVIDGHRRIYKTRKSPWKNAQGTVIGIAGVSADITRLKEMERELLASEENLTAALNASDQLIALIKADGTVIAANAVAAAYVGTPLNEAIGRNLNDLLPAGLIRLRTPYFERVIATGRPEHFEECQAGRHLLNYLYPIVGAGGIVERIAIYTHDMTELVDAHEKTSITLQRYQTLLQTANDGIHILNEDGNIVEANEAFCRMLGYTQDQLLGMNVSAWDIKWSSEELRDRHADSLGRSSVFETRHRRKDGSEYDVEISATGVTIAGKRYLHASARDISERRRAEEKISSLLAEKELVLKEVHHRIKNNMNTIRSLLRLHAGTLRSHEAIAALDDAVTRIGSMMVLYDKLYQSSNFSEVSLGEFLPSLINQILEAFPVPFEINIETHVDDILLDAQKMQPLAIIINELVTNILKYAFPGRSRGTIVASATAVEKLVSVSIQDDGVGMPEGISSHNSTGFGLMLIETLTKQLRGQLRIVDGEGTRVTIEFER